jgi:hypothetical protein
MTDFSRRIAKYASLFGTCEVEGYQISINPFGYINDLPASEFYQIGKNCYRVIDLLALAFFEFKSSSPFVVETTEDWSFDFEPERTIASLKVRQDGTYLKRNTRGKYFVMSYSRFLKALRQRRSSGEPMQLSADEEFDSAWRTATAERRRVQKEERVAEEERRRKLALEKHAAEVKAAFEAAERAREAEIRSRNRTSSRYFVPFFGCSSVVCDGEYHLSSDVVLPPDPDQWVMDPDLAMYLGEQRACIPMSPRYRQ